MNVKLFSTEYLIVCKFCKNYVAHSSHINRIGVEYISGIKFKQFIIEREYCNMYVGIKDAVYCNHCEKIIGISDLIERGTSHVKLFNVQFSYDVSIM